MGWLLHIKSKSWEMLRSWELFQILQNKQEAVSSVFDALD